MLNLEDYQCHRKSRYIYDNRRQRSDYFENRQCILRTLAVWFDFIADSSNISCNIFVPGETEYQSDNIKVTSVCETTAYSQANIGGYEFKRTFNSVGVILELIYLVWPYTKTTAGTYQTISPVEWDVRPLSGFNVPTKTKRGNKVRYQVFSVITVK